MKNTAAPPGARSAPRGGKGWSTDPQVAYLASSDCRPSSGRSTLSRRTGSWAAPPWRDICTRLERPAPIVLAG